MKRILLLIGLILTIEMYGQQSPCFFMQTNSPIYIYESENSKIPFAMINQDSIIENYYSVEILKTASEKYMVKIMCAASFSKASIEGWVKKDLCFVWLWPVGQDNFINIYEDPVQSSRHVKVDLTNHSNIAVPVQDVSKDGWYLVTVTKRKHSLSGWTKNVCANIYGSCEHGNPYSHQQP